MVRCAVMLRRFYSTPQYGCAHPLWCNFEDDTKAVCTAAVGSAEEITVRVEYQTAERSCPVAAIGEFVHGISRPPAAVRCQAEDVSDIARASGGRGAV